MTKTAPSNVLVLLSDEHHADVMGVAGHQLARTPHLDALAARGTRFTNAYTPSPICVPARASVATGLYVHQHRCWDNAIAYDGRDKSWGHRLQEAGVRVESVGKLHYVDAAKDTGFDAQHVPMHIHGGIGQVWGSVRDPLPDQAPAGGMFADLGAGESAYNRFDRDVATLATQWLDKRATDTTPWVLFVGFVAPHFPLIVPSAYLEQFPVDDMPLPRLRPQEGYRRHPWADIQARFGGHDEEIATDARRRLAIASYLGLTSFMDEQVGRVLTSLRQSGLNGTTTVIYASDHGDNLGVRGMWNKSTLYREATAIPMILAGPGVPQNQLRRTNVSLIDLYPTILQAAGVSSDAMKGPLPRGSLRDLANQPDDDARLAFSEYHAIGSAGGAFMLADGRYKFHHYEGFEPELFDLSTDRGETDNLATKPEHRDTVARFSQRLRDLVDPAAVDHRAKADQAALVARFGGREQALNTGTRGATPAPITSPSVAPSLRGA